LENKPAEQSSVKIKLTEDLHQSMKSGNKEKVGVIRLLLSAIRNGEIAKQGELAGKGQEGVEISFTDADVYGVIAREVRQRKESIESFKAGNRPDLVAQEEGEMAILVTYLPKQATHEDIVAAAKRIIAETGAQGQKDKGKVMPKLVAEFKGKADGRVINEVVSELLK
jgi:uncharacterized protein